METQNTLNIKTILIYKNKVGIITLLKSFNNQKCKKLSQNRYINVKKYRIQK